MNFFDHLTQKDLLLPEQDGFLARYSIDIQLLESINDWSDAIDHDEYVDICYFDFSRAYNSVSLPKLVQKLAAYGIIKPAYSISGLHMVYQACIWYIRPVFGLAEDISYR